MLYEKVKIIFLSLDKDYRRIVGSARANLNSIKLLVVKAAVVIMKPAICWQF